MDHPLLLQHIQSKVTLSEQDFEAFSRLLTAVTVPKGHRLIEEGKRNDKLYFIEQGLVYSFKTLDDGSTQVIQFAKEHYWITDLCSFFNNTSSSLFSIETIEDCTLLSLSRQQYDTLCLQNDRIATYFRLAIQTAYTHTLQRLSDVYTEDAATKYARFMEGFFEISQRVPQYLIASYLGILPSSLSRIRSQKRNK